MDYYQLQPHQLLTYLLKKLSHQPYLNKLEYIKVDCKTNAYSIHSHSLWQKFLHYEALQFF